MSRLKQAKKKDGKKIRCLEYFPRSNLYIFSDEAIEDSRVYILNLVLIYTSKYVLFIMN